eukprot:6177588-Pleurochrysis_carterae.AAC.2
MNLIGVLTWNHRARSPSKLNSVLMIKSACEAGYESRMSFRSAGSHSSSSCVGVRSKVGIACAKETAVWSSPQAGSAFSAAAGAPGRPRQRPRHLRYQSC